MPSLVRRVDGRVWVRTSVLSHVHGSQQQVSTGRTGDATMQDTTTYLTTPRQYPNHDTSGSHLILTHSKRTRTQREHTRVHGHTPKLHTYKHAQLRAATDLVPPHVAIHEDVHGNVGGSVRRQRLCQRPCRTLRSRWRPWSTRLPRLRRLATAQTTNDGTSTTSRRVTSAINVDSTPQPSGLAEQAPYTGGTRHHQKGRTEMRDSRTRVHRH